MKKIIDFKKWKKKLVAMTPRFEVVLAFISFLTYAILEDLRVCFSINFANLSRVVSSCFIMSFVWALCWLIELIIYSILKRKEQKKKHENKSKSN